MVAGVGGGRSSSQMTDRKQKARLKCAIHNMPHILQLDPNLLKFPEPLKIAPSARDQAFKT
jgi:hypothetical protein